MILARRVFTLASNARSRYDPFTHDNPDILWIVSTAEHDPQARSDREQLAARSGRLRFWGRTDHQTCEVQP